MQGLERFLRACFLARREQDRHQQIDIKMENNTAELTQLMELDERHDELLRQIDELDKQVAAVLAQWTAEHAAQQKAA